MDPTIQKYLHRHALTRPVEMRRPQRTAVIDTAVVIPAFREADALPKTLESLAENPEKQLRRTLVLVIVNNPSPDPRDTTALEAVRENLQTLRWLEESARSLPLNLAWIDATSPGHCLPGRGGVGLARRIGCDSVLETLLAHRNGPARPDRPPVLFHLDADTIVEPDYLEAANELIESETAGGTIPFQHQKAGSRRLQMAIDCYELYMHHYVAGLAFAQSPYAFHTVGSAMVSTLEGYVRAGGMPRKRLAGEDFYFLQNLARTGGVTPLTITTVHPSPRPSDRVPFGTGPRVAQALKTDTPEFTVFNPTCYRILKTLRKTILQGLRKQQNVQTICTDIPAETTEFLKKQRLLDVLPRFQKQFQATDKQIRAFEEWFDGLTTFRLIKTLSETVAPEMPLMKGWKRLLQMLESDIPADSPQQLLKAWRKDLPRLPGKTP